MRVGPLFTSELSVLLLFFAVSLLPLFLFWRIFSKAGFPGALSLLLLMPGFGLLVASIILATAEWPALRHNS